jgi:uncharacterized FlaG/YvyC family protein
LFALPNGSAHTKRIKEVEKTGSRIQSARNKTRTQQCLKRKRRRQNTKEQQKRTTHEQPTQRALNTEEPIEKTKCSLKHRRAMSFSA